MTDTNRPEAVHDVLRDMRQWKGDYSVFADRIERALSARASAPETLRCKQCGNEWPDYLLSSGSCIKCKKATPPAHGDGEGEIVGEVVMCDGYEAGVQVYKPHLVVRWAKRYMPAVGTKLYAAPQPAQNAETDIDYLNSQAAGASGGECNVEGTWLWGRLMDWCRMQGVPPSNYNELFAIARDAHKLFTPASPATGDDPCIECGADPGEACYPNCCTQTPQPAAASEWVMVPRKLTNAMQIAGLTALDESDATPESIGHLIGYKAIRESYAAMLAAAPQPQEKE